MPTCGEVRTLAAATAAVILLLIVSSRAEDSYGLAPTNILDVNAKYSDHWRWASKAGNDPKWQNQIPVPVVRIFEKHGFIWGGYWYHYDTMHFEYRPELLPAGED
jgi:hypothetical protein